MRRVKRYCSPNSSNAISFWFGPKYRDSFGKMRSAAFLLLAHCMSTYAGEDVTDHPNWHLLDHDRCGESLSDRIIGGTEASLGQYPWMARLGYRKVYDPAVKPAIFKCGGSLISHVYVLTAAHCVTQLDNDSLVAIRLGELDARTDIDCDGEYCAPAVQDFKPVVVVYHSRYHIPGGMKNDLGLIRLDRPAVFNEFVAPICLPYGSLLTKDHVGSIMEVAGWGVNNLENKHVSSVLLHVRVPIVNRSICDVNLAKFGPLWDGQLCAGGQIGFDSCGGDSGGPLMKAEAVDGPPKYFVIGVVSFGAVKCGGKAPAVYTHVARYVPWILDEMQP